MPRPSFGAHKPISDKNKNVFSHLTRPRTQWFDTPQNTPIFVTWPMSPNEYLTCQSEFLALSSKFFSHPNPFWSVKLKFWRVHLFFEMTRPFVGAPKTYFLRTKNVFVAPTRPTHPHALCFDAPETSLFLWRAQRVQMNFWRPQVNYWRS